MISLAFLLTIFSTSSFAQSSKEIGGKTVYCRNATILVDHQLPNLGISDTEGNIILNPDLLNEQPLVVRWFVFYHECGHTHVGASELLADCWAINRGHSEGWLAEKDLSAICGSWQGAPATRTHPSALRRCQNINRCFQKLKVKNASSTSVNKQ